MRRAGEIGCFSHQRDPRHPRTSSLVQTNIGVNEPAEFGRITQDGHSLKDGRNLCARIEIRAALNC